MTDFARVKALAFDYYGTIANKQALAAEIDRFQRQGMVRNVRTESDGCTHSSQQANLQLIPLFDKSPLLRALPFTPKVADAVSRLIGDPYLLHLDQMFLKPARVGTGTSWHQDNAYFKIADPLRGTAMWLAVHDAMVDNGTLRPIPGQRQHLRPQCRQHERNRRCTGNGNLHVGTVFVSTILDCLTLKNGFQHTQVVSHVRHVSLIRKTIHSINDHFMRKSDTERESPPTGYLGS